MNDRLPLRVRLYGTRAVHDGSAPDVPELVPSAHAEGNAPLTFAQRRIWFYDQLYPGDPLYHGAEAYRIRGDLDVASLRAALDALIIRQPALRTCFAAVRGVPEQRVGDVLPFPLHAIDATGVDEALAACVEIARRPFDLAKARSLARAVLVRIAHDDHVLALVFHHAIWDGTSMGIVYDDLAFAYDAQRSGFGRAAQPLPITYADFARWQRAVFTDDALAVQRAYWRGALADVPRLAMRTDRPHPAERSRRGARLWRPRLLDRDTVAALRALAHDEGATLFTALLTAYSAILHRESGQDEVAVGFPVAGRLDERCAQVVGCFINMLVLRANFSGRPTFVTALRRVRDALAAAYEHQDVPFEAVVADRSKRPSLARGPIFDVMLNFRGVRTPSLRLTGLETTPLQIDFGIATYDQTFELSETPDGIDARMQYSTDVFDAPTIERLVASVGAFAKSAAAAPLVPIAEVALHESDSLSSSRTSLSESPSNSASA